MLRKLLTGPYFFIITGLVCLIPLIFLAFFNHPSVDDYLVAIELKQRNFWNAQVYWYFNWTGRFSSTALISLMHPLNFRSFLFYRLDAILILFIYFWSLFYLAKAVFKSNTIVENCAIAFTFGICYLDVLPSISSAVYWFTGAYTYTLGSILTILFVAELINWNTSGKTTSYYLMLFWGVFAIGSNEITLFITLFITGLFFLNRLIARAKLNAKIWLMAGILGISTVAALFAPGNAVRGKIIEHDNVKAELPIYNIAHSIRESLLQSFNDITSWAFLSSLAVVTLLAIIFRTKLRIAGKKVLHPALIWLGSFALIVFLYFIYYYKTGVTGQLAFPGRVRNEICFFFCFTWIGSLIYTLEWLEQNRNFVLFKTALNPLLIRAISFAFALLVVFSGNIYIALKDIRSRTFLAYHNEMESRYEKLRTFPKDTVIVDTLIYHPQTIYFFDISDKYWHWSNVYFAAYYGKKAVKVEAPSDSLSQYK